MSKTRKGDHQKLKMLYLMKLFMEETDDDHGLTMPQIIEKLSYYGVNAERKTLYLDFEELRDFGVDLQCEKSGRNSFYHIGSRDFELPELKLLVDSVQSSKFITDKKSKELIEKLENLVSQYQARQLHRQVIMSGRIKTMNEKIYYNVDCIHEAIGKEHQIQFQYFQWNLNKEMELKKNGALYHVSPWVLMWDDENYYLVAYDHHSKKIKHYRVDKMLHVEIIPKKRIGEDAFKNFNMPHYTKSLFGMYGGKEEKVTLVVKNELIGVFIDRFGKDIFITPVDNHFFKASVTVAISNQFLGWIMSLGNQVKIIAPDTVVELMKTEIKDLSNLYCVK